MSLRTSLRRFLSARLLTAEEAGRRPEAVMYADCPIPVLGPNPNERRRIPERNAARKQMGPAGFEPATYGL